MKYVSPEYQQRLDDLAERLVIGRFAVVASEEQQAEAAIAAASAECLAEEEQRLGRFSLPVEAEAHLVLGTE